MIMETAQKMILFYDLHIKNKLDKKEILQKVWNKLSKIQKKILNNIIIDTIILIF